MQRDDQDIDTVPHSPTTGGELDITLHCDWQCLLPLTAIAIGVLPSPSQLYFDISPLSIDSGLGSGQQYCLFVARPNHDAQ